MSYPRSPFCSDCGVGTITLGEWYMVKDEIWEQAWAGRRKSWYGEVDGREILCIGCLEERIGRTLVTCDFTDAPVNHPNDEWMSDRLYDRLTTWPLQLEMFPDVVGNGR
jgi:hypothetical protein